MDLVGMSAVEAAAATTTTQRAHRMSFVISLLAIVMLSTLQARASWLEKRVLKRMLQFAVAMEIPTIMIVCGAVPASTKQALGCVPVMIVYTPKVVPVMIVCTPEAATIRLLYSANIPRETALGQLASALQSPDNAAAQKLHQCVDVMAIPTSTTATDVKRRKANRLTGHVLAFALQILTALHPMNFATKDQCSIVMMHGRMKVDASCSTTLVQHFILQSVDVTASPTITIV
jgi:hypothetical protein